MPLQLSESDFRSIRDLICERFGIWLPDQKRSLVASRLRNHLGVLGLTCFRDYYDRCRAAGGESLLSELANRITTNHTFFGREKRHFEFLREEVLGQIIEERERQQRRDLRVWCAAAATGEEAYMLAMMVRDALGSKPGRWRSGVLATDISAAALEEAEAGRYSASSAERLPAELRRRYFQRVSDGDYEVDAKLRADVTFRRFNLVNRSYPFRKPFHVIFCRNVLMYFDEDERARVIERLHEFTEPGGYLFVGLTERVDRARCPYEYIETGIYRRRVEP